MISEQIGEEVVGNCSGSIVEKVRKVTKNFRIAGPLVDI
jgi:hypothetical protein